MHQDIKGWDSRKWRHLPTLVRRAMAQQGKREFFERLTNTYYSNVLNLHLALPSTKTPRQVRRIARGAVATYLRNEAEYLAPRRWAGFRVRHPEILDQALAQDRGAVVACQHLGPQRFSLVEVARKAPRIHAAVTEQFIDRLQEWLDRMEADFDQEGAEREVAELVRRVSPLSVESPTCALKMVRALKRKEVVMFDVDGNIGVGGEERTRQGTLMLSFLDRDIHVRTGMAYLSHRTGAPIVPVITLWGKKGPEMHFHEALSPRRGESREAYTERSLRRVYGLLEGTLREHPEQWEMWPHFFKWLTPPSPLGMGKDRLEEVQEELRAALEGSSETPLRADPRRVFVLRIRDKRLLVDRQSFRFFLTSRQSERLLERLHRGTTLRRIVRDLRSSLSVDEVLRELARFRLLGIFGSAPTTA